MDFRHYSPSESSELHELFFSVFSDSDGEAEGRLIGNLAKDLLKSTAAEDLFVFIAVEDHEIIGAICVTRMVTEKGADPFILAPVAVDTKNQGKGVGQKLIKYGIEELKRHGVKVLVTYGDPNFYSKTGFEPISVKMIQPPFVLSQPEGWLGQSLDGNPLRKIEGRCSCVSSLNDSSFW